MAGVRYVPPSYREGTKILQRPQVRKALRARAEQIAPRANALARAAKLDEAAASIEVRNGIRPKGRPYSYVVMDHPDGEKNEFGDTNTARRRILGRAAGTG
jgi:hypothetical protein